MPRYEGSRMVCRAEWYQNQKIPSRTFNLLVLANMKPNCRYPAQLYRKDDPIPTLGSTTKVGLNTCCRYLKLNEQVAKSQECLALL